MFNFRLRSMYENHAKSPDFGKTCKDFNVQTFTEPEMLSSSLFLTPLSHLLEFEILLNVVVDCCSQQMLDFL